MPLGIYNSNAFKSVAGDIQISASANVEVRRESDGALASIFSDRAGASPITQVAYPGTSGFKAGADGYFEFYSAGNTGGLRVRVYSDDLSLDKTVRYQPVGSARELDADPFWVGPLAAATARAARSALTAMGVEGTADRATNTILGAANSGGRFVATGSFTQTFDAAATLGGDWHVHYRVNAGQTVTLDPNLAELIDGAATKVVVGPAAGYIVCDGSVFHTFGFDGPAASDTVAGRIELATQAEQETGTDVLRAVSPGRQHFHQSAAKAYVRWAYAAGVPEIQGTTYNVSSLTDTGVGLVTVNFSTAFSSADYVGVIGNGVGSTGTSGGISQFIQDADYLAGSALVRSALGTTATDFNAAVAFFGDH